MQSQHQSEQTTVTLFMNQSSDPKNTKKIYNEYITSSCCDQKVFDSILVATLSEKGKYIFIDNTGGMNIDQRISLSTFPNAHTFESSSFILE